MRAWMVTMRHGAWLLSLLLGGRAACAGEVSLGINGPSGSPVAEAVASLDPVGRSVAPAAQATAVMDQRGLAFVPQVLAVQVGTAVKFPNSDQVRHHVYSFSSAKPFELRLYSGHDAQPVVFDKPGLVTLGCNIHDWMLGFIYVLDTPYFGISDAAGKIRLKSIPAGDYRLRVWQPFSKSAGSVADEQVHVDADGEVRRSYIVSLHPPEHTNAPPPDVGLGSYGEAPDHG